MDRPLRNITVPTRLSSLPDAQFPVWNGDASLVFYASTPDDKYSLFFTRADGSGVPRLALRPEARAPESWSSAHEGLTLITLAGDDYDVWFYSMADRRVIAVAAQKGTDQSVSQFSFDGRWIAYESDETGRFEVYVTTFPPSGTPFRVTHGGGRRPVWASENELSFDADNRLFVVKLETSPSLSAGEPTSLPIEGFVQGDARRQYDKLPDGRYLMIMQGEAR